MAPKMFLALCSKLVGLTQSELLSQSSSVGLHLVATLTRPLLCAWLYGKGYVKSQTNTLNTGMEVIRRNDQGLLTVRLLSSPG